MTGYLIVRNEDGAYVADMQRSTTGSSYTNNLKVARIFEDYGTAKANCCGNEYVATVESQLPQPY